MKKELAYFNIDKSYGGNQRWMRDWWMHIGGCAALTTCDVLIYCALHKNRPELFDVNNLTRRGYRKFAMSMKHYLQPRTSGIKDLDTYMRGVRLYMEDEEIEGISLSFVEGDENFEKVKERVVKSIDDGMPAAYLLLKHKEKKFSFFEWHWFIVIGYDEREDGIYIKTATYGAAHWLKLEEIWDTGCEEKGGVVFFDEER